MVIFACLWKFLLLALTDGLKEVYVVPHSHCDPGWIETLDYYYSTKVEDILDNIFVLLEENPERKFVWSEISFFSMWYDNQDVLKQQEVKNALMNGQLEFVGGGWVQHDEALTNVDDITLQLDLGHKWIERTFGKAYLPRVGWQLDPFGASAVTPGLLSQFGYDYLVINRIHADVKAKLKKKQAMLFLWKGSDLGPKSDILTYVLSHHYDYPPHISFRQTKYEQIREQAQKLYDLLSKWSEGYDSEKIMLLFGDDFAFSNLEDTRQKFQSLEQIMEMMTAMKRIDVKFSTPNQFFDDLVLESQTFQYYTGDFFPYMTQIVEKDLSLYWTGFYTSRPQLKHQIFESWKLNRATNIMSGLVLNKNYNSEQVAYTLHHDAITGTCRPKVIDDYLRRLDQAKKSAFETMSRAVQKFPLEEPEADESEYDRHVTFYNPLNRERTELLTIDSPTQYIEIIYNGHAVKSQVIEDRATYKIYWIAKLPGLSLTTFNIEEHDSF